MAGENRTGRLKKMERFGYAFPETAASAAAKAATAVADAGAADAVPHLLEAAAGEGMLARHHFVEDDRQRPDIVGFLPPGRLNTPLFRLGDGENESHGA